MDKMRKIIIVILTITGIILSAELCKIYYDANFNDYALASFCSVNNLIDCDGVAKTSYAQFLGVPLCLWGLFFYSFVLLMLAAKYLAKIRIFKFLEVFKNPRAYIFSLGTLAFMISMVLAAIQFFEINKICILCFATYFVDFAIALTAKDYKKPIFYESKQSFEDFKSAVSIKKYLIAFLIVSAAAAGVLIYTQTSYILTPQLKIEKIKLTQERNFITRDNIMGAADATIVIHEYMDFNCSSCYVTNISLNRLMSELDGIMIIKHDLPLDSECNPLLKNGGHKGSCTMARYALASKKQDKYWEVSDILFTQTPDSEQKILKLLRQIKGLDIKRLEKDANSEEIKKELNSEIQDAISREINATPTLIINMQKITGNMPYYELREKLVQMGAKEKKPK